VYWEGDTKEMGTKQVWGADDINAEKWLDTVLLPNSRVDLKERQSVLDGFKAMMRSPVAAEVMKLGHEKVFVDAVRRLFATGFLTPLQFLQCAIDIFPSRHGHASDLEEEDSPALLLVADAFKKYKATSIETRGKMGPELLFKAFANGYPSHVVATLLDISPNLVDARMETHPWYVMHAQRRGDVHRPYTSPLANALLFEGNARPEYARSYLDVIRSRHPCSLLTTVEETGPLSSPAPLLLGLFSTKKTLYDGYASIWKQIVRTITQGLDRKSYIPSVFRMLDLFVDINSQSDHRLFTRKDVKQILAAFQVRLEEWSVNRRSIRSGKLSSEIDAYFRVVRSRSESKSPGADSSLH
jgi:hypothetical protein